MIQSLFTETRQVPANVLGKYEDYHEANVYVEGFRRVVTAAENFSPHLFLSMLFRQELLFGPLRYFRMRVPLSDLRRLPEASYLAPDQRLQTLTKNVGGASQYGWLDDVFQILDKHHPSLVVMVEPLIEAHERSAP